MTGIKGKYKRIALALSVCLFVIWGILGTGASLAWFTDTSPEIKNIFHFADFDLVVSHRQDGVWREIDSETSIFDENALYEPGYVQVVYLRVENRGNVPFDYKTAVSVTNYTPASNVFGQTFYLQEYLRFGLVTANTEAELLAKLDDREAAVANAQMPLNYYSTDTEILEADSKTYMALIVQMPKEVGNDANYRGEPPRVELGLIVSANQLKQ